MRSVSKKRAKELREYTKLRKSFLDSRPYCEILRPTCTRMASDIHHMNHREGKRLLEVVYWLPVCRACHTYITNNPAYAREMGFTLL